MNNTFLLSWDCYGLEYIEDITSFERRVLWNTIEGTETNLPFSLNALVLRARYNPQRHYEIYTITTIEDISKEDLVEAFTDNPQGTAEMIRAQGRKIYSDRQDTENRVIT